jgi:SAM-dependent methyltransferase
MDLIESGNMSADDEFNHWWVTTRFAYVDQALALASAHRETMSVLEFGCGTAPNLRFCRQRSRFRNRIGQLSGVDSNLGAPRRFPWMLDGDTLTQEATSCSPYDILLAMDVLEHVHDDVKALSDWLALVKPGGYVLITVPAFGWLWSYHDERLGHVRRHTRASVERLATRCGLERVRTRYAFGYMLPLVLVVRKLLRSGGESTDLRRHSAPVNWLLKRIGQIEAWSGGNRWAGTSVVGTFRKPL